MQKTPYNPLMQMLPRKLLLGVVLLGLVQPLASLASQHTKSQRSEKTTHNKVATSVAKVTKKSTLQKSIAQHVAHANGAAKSSKARLAANSKKIASKATKSKLASAKSHPSVQVKHHNPLADAASSPERLVNNAANQGNLQPFTNAPSSTAKLTVANVAAVALATASSPEVTQSTMSPVAPAQVDEQDSSWSTSVQEVLIKAISLTGIRYKFGGISPDTGFDCSGFVRYVFMQALNLNLPHGARAISQLGQSVAVNELKPGDLVFFNTLKSTFSHVGIYVGNNRFIHSPSSGGGVTIVDMSDDYWAKRFNGARRIQSPQASNP